MEPLSAQINAVEENIASIVRRNDIVDEEIQGIKSDMISLADKILAIKVSSFYERFQILVFDFLKVDQNPFLTEHLT